MTTKYIIDNLDVSLTEQVIYGGLSADTFSATTLYVDGSQITKPYKVYTALLNQTGTDAPIATVLENTLGGEVIWSRVGVGIYSAILANAFTADNTIFPQGIEWTAGLGVVPLTINTFFDHGYQIYRIDSNEINFATYDSSYVSKELSDISNSAKIFIEIRVYN
jgi:hypothetical protein